MKSLVTKKLFKNITYGIFFLHIPIIAYALLPIKTVTTIVGSKPKLAETLEKSLDDFSLFGLTVNNKNYYGDEIKQIPISVSYPFRDNFKVAPIKQPDTNQYVDIDGDELNILDFKDTSQMVWYYTNANDELVEFKPKASDTFCSLTKAGKSAPYKITVSGDIVLSSKYGTPNNNEYPNDDILTHPTKTYTILEDVGICYAKPELEPIEAANSELNHWDKNQGFLIQSNIDASKNFPTTAFYGAKFDLMLSKKGLSDNYDWKIVKGAELITITPDQSQNGNRDFVTVAFNTENAKNTQIAWDYVIGSGSGFPVVIQGENKVTKKIIEYSFIITKWFSDWDKSIIGQPLAHIGSATDIANGCLSLDGNYRISHADEVSNAPMGERPGDAKFTREIGTVLGEWGNANQIAYPNSWAASKSQNNQHKRIWLRDTVENKYCDLHMYNAKYHCRDEGEPKNGLCTAVK